MSLSLYVHIPFCKNRCFYCDFFSSINLDCSAYANAVKKEIESLDGGQLYTIYFGGGTPSMLSVNDFEIIANAIKTKFDLSKLCEWTVECNPESINAQKLEAYKKAGVNRLSFGVQSFDDEKLRRIGRITSAKQAQEAIILASNIGFSNISADLMVGFEGQTLDEVISDAQKLINLNVSHISCYMLELAEKTKLFKMTENKEYFPLEKDECEKVFSGLSQFLENQGFFRYEISNFAKSGFMSRHNMMYWSQKKYIGIGAGAHSYDGEKRSANTLNLKKYIEGDNYKMVEKLNCEEKVEELIMLGLRNWQGVDLEKLKELGYDILKSDICLNYIKLGILNFKPNKLTLNKAYYNVSNKIIIDLLSDIT